VSAPTVTCQVEDYSTFMREAAPLLQEQYDELAQHKEHVPLDPDWAHYQQREAQDQLLVVTARESGRMVGYFVGFVAPALHYRTLLTLTMDLFWLEPAMRAIDSLDRIEADMLAKELFDTVILEAKRRGVKRPYFGSKVVKDAHVLFESLGLVEVERYYSGWWGE
jgi:hypothetical protein